MNYAAYRDFIASKAISSVRHGFTPSGLPDRLFEHQGRAV